MVLKSCPECKSKNVFVMSHEWGQDYYIECLSCGHRTDLYMYKWKAIKEWNKEKEKTA